MAAPWRSPGGPRGGSALIWSGVIWAARALSAREGSGALRPDSVHDEPSGEALSPGLRLRSLTLGRSRGRVLAPACRVTGAAPKGDPVVRGPRPKRSGPCPRCGLVPVLAILRLPRRSRSISELVRFAGTQAHRAFVYVVRDSDSGRACGAGPKQACRARVVCFHFPRELQFPLPCAIAVWSSKIPILLLRKPPQVPCGRLVPKDVALRLFPLATALPVRGNVRIRSEEGG